MDFGKNIFEIVQDQVIWLILTIIIIGGVMMAWKRQFSLLLGFIILMGIIGAMVADPKGVVVDTGVKIWKAVSGT